MTFRSVLKRTAIFSRIEARQSVLKLLTIQAQKLSLLACLQVHAPSLRTCSSNQAPANPAFMQVQRMELS